MSADWCSWKDRKVTTMRRPMLPMVLMALLAAGTSVTSAMAQDLGADLEMLGSELDSQAERIAVIEDQYDRVLEDLGFPGGLDALALDPDIVRRLVAATADRLEARTRGRGTAFLEFLTGIADLSRAKDLVLVTIPAFVDMLRSWWPGDSSDEQIVSSVRNHVQSVNALLVQIRGMLQEIETVLDRVETELASL